MLQVEILFGFCEGEGTGPLSAFPEATCCRSTPHARGEVNKFEGRVSFLIHLEVRGSDSSKRLVKESPQHT